VIFVLSADQRHQARQVKHVSSMSAALQQQATHVSSRQRMSAESKALQQQVKHVSRTALNPLV